MKKVSIIIPNYNNSKYIEDCLNSATKQDYPEKEIIVVDDGSTDDSVEKVEKYIKNNKNDDVRLIQQSNLNAAIARNNGMKNAAGDYVLFLDSDDLLEEGVLKRMVEYYEKDKTDLVVGGYKEIDEKGHVYGNKRLTNDQAVLEADKDFIRLMSIKPAPSNKLYDFNLIRENNLTWDNVRIGQDLNFYLKYLSLCKKVSLIDLNIYKYRNTPNSMSRSFDFRIFDIVNVFEGVKKYYAQHKKERLFAHYIPMCALKHYSNQMDKQVYYHSFRERKLIVNYFSVCEKQLDYSKCVVNSDFKKLHTKFIIKRTLWPIFTSKLYYAYIIRKKRSNG